MAKLYEVTLRGRYIGEGVINRLSFVTDNENATTAASLALANALGYIPTTNNAPQPNSVLDRYLEAQTDNFALEGIIIRNLFSTTDFFTASLAGVGWQGTIVAGADIQLPFVASKIQTNRIRSDVRRGSLALSPMPEEMMDGPGLLNTAGIALLQALCNALNEPPADTDGDSTTQFIPSVFGKLEYEVPNRTDGRTAYKYYPSPEQQLEHTAVGVAWTPITRVTSQTTRRVGRGM